MLKYILLTTFILFLHNETFAQKNRQELGLAIYNCGLGGFTSGVGAIINKKKNEKILNVFWRGFKYGSLGGLINYSGKRLTYLISYSKDSLTNEKNTSALLWGWPAKIVHGIGSSIMDNAAANKSKIFADYNIPIGFINLSVKINNRISINPQLMPISFIEFITNNLRPGSKLRFKESILIGTPYFIADDNTPYLLGHNGIASSNSIVLTFNAAASSLSGFLLAHEYVHILQQREYLVFNQYLIKPFNSIIKQDKKSVKLMKKYIYADLQYLSFFYGITQHPFETYYKNIFELEAEHFATNTYIRQ